MQQANTVVVFACCFCCSSEKTILSIIIFMDNEQCQNVLKMLVSCYERKPERNVLFFGLLVERLSKHGSSVHC